MRPSPHGLAVSFRETGGRDRVRGRVLLVDDHRDVSGMLQTLLEDEGYFVSIAEDLDDARSALDYLPVDVVILDDRLPSGRGSSVADQAERHGIRMLVMSGYPASFEQFGRSTGFIAKPFRGYRADEAPQAVDRLNLAGGPSPHRRRGHCDAGTKSPLAVFCGNSLIPSHHTGPKALIWRQDLCIVRVSNRPDAALHRHRLDAF